MYAHLELKNATPVAAAGYFTNGNFTFAYGDITIETEIAFFEGADSGTISLCFYSNDKAFGLAGGELPEGMDEQSFLSKALPAKDMVYILSLLGLIRPADLYKNRRRVRVETPRARKHKFYERLEVFLSQSVDTVWLREYGRMFGYRLTGK